MLSSSPEPKFHVTVKHSLVSTPSGPSPQNNAEKRQTFLPFSVTRDKSKWNDIRNFKMTDINWFNEKNAMLR